MRFGLVAIVVAVLVVGAKAPGRADITATPEFDALLAAYFALAKTIAFAHAAEARGALDAAIAALEQLLIRYSDEIGAHEDLARLYTAVGNTSLGALHASRAGNEQTRVWGRA